MEIREIEPRFEELEQRVGALEGEPESSINDAESVSAESENSEAVPRQSELQALVEKDAKLFPADAVARAICKHPILGSAREDVFIMEEARSIKAQPFRLTDGNFRVLSRPMIEKVVAETKIDQVKWMEDVSDCEDIALRFNARCLELGFNSCGRVLSWSGGHCFILFIVRGEDDELDFLFLEPQTDAFIEPGEGQYSMENTLILIN